METVAEKIPSVPEENSEPRRLGQVIATLSHRFDAQRIGSGDLAALRRITRDDLPPAFWRLYLDDNIIPESWRVRKNKSDSLILAWAAIIRAMVEMVPNPHSFDNSFGGALASSGYSEDRIVRLLRSRGDNLAREIRIAGAWLAVKGVGKVNWLQPAELILCDSGIQTHRSRIVRRLASDYFRAQAKQSH